MKQLLTILSVVSFIAVRGQNQENPQPSDTLASLSAVVPLQDVFLPAPDVEFIPGDLPPGLLADRLSCIPSNFPLEYRDEVRASIEFFTVRNREFTKRVMRRKELYFPIFEKYLAQYGLPDELKYLSIIESGLVPNAVSRAKAVGLWQFMPSTGKHYGLHTSWYWDERMDPERSTEAACRLLKELYRMFNDWPLALAAYNSGPGTVLKANKKSGYKNSYWDLFPYLPKETRSYVPHFIAMVYVMKYAPHHNFHEPDPEKPLPSDTLQVTSFLNLDVLKNLTGTCKDDFKQLNPQVLAAYIPDNDKTHILRLPVEAKMNLDKNRAMIMDSARRHNREKLQDMASKMEEKQFVYHKVVRGSSLGTIAAKYGVRVTDIRTWNGMKSNTIHPGQLLKVYPAPGRGRTSGAAVATGKSAPKPEPKSNVYVVQKGDTLWSIAQQTGQSVEKLRSLNNITGDRLSPGQKITVR